MNAPPEPLLAAARPPWGGFPGSALLTDFAPPAALRSPYPSPAYSPGFTADYLPCNRGVEVIAWGCR